MSEFRVLEAAKEFDHAVATAPREGGCNRQAVTYSTPLISDALGCHSGQVQEFNEFYRERGVTGAYHRKDGKLVIGDNAARNEVMKLRGLYDRDAGYGQYAGSGAD